MKARTRVLYPLLGLAAAAIASAALAADETAIPSKWKVQEIRFSYVGFTTAYDCDSAASKVQAILMTLGAHPDTKVRATGCPSTRPSRNFFVRITAATPVPAADVKVNESEASRQELLKRLGVENGLSEEEFPATWKSIELSKERKLDIRPGDCELVETLRKQVLPKLSVKVEAERISCTPNQVSLLPPQLRVSALVPMKSPDTKDASR